MNRTHKQQPPGCGIEISSGLTGTTTDFVPASFASYTLLAAGAHAEAPDYRINSQDGLWNPAPSQPAKDTEIAPDTTSAAPKRGICRVCNNTPGISIVESHTCARIAAIEDPEGVMAFLLELVTLT
jgi:hypothetical protein